MLVFQDILNQTQFTRTAIKQAPLTDPDRTISRKDVDNRRKLLR